MQFNSYIFILLFLPVMVLSYYLLGKINIIAGKFAIIIGSVIFYAYTDITMLNIIGLSLVMNYLFVLLIAKTEWKKLFMFVPVVINVLLLLYFKYTNFFLANINTLFGTKYEFKQLILPLGISFFTFQQIAYVVAVYRKEIESINVIDYVSYILYFPKILMGPLMDPVDFISQYNDSELKKINLNNIAYGLKLFSFGLFKKLLIADTFSKMVSWGFDNVNRMSSVEIILIMLFYTFEIYFDFSGYTDMAVGVSQMLNITLPINFDSPYKASSIRDFWKRWHISLTKFFTKYIYIPLGGSKKGDLFTYINTMIVFVVSGIWHGANWTFILWGILHGAFSILDRLLDKLPKDLFKHGRKILTFIVINILWLLFRAQSITQWANMLTTIISFKSRTVNDGLIKAFSFPEADLIFSNVHFLNKISSKINGFTMYVFLVIAAFICFVPDNNYKKMKKLSAVSMVLSAIAIVLGITCLGSESVFVYFNF